MLKIREYLHNSRNVMFAEVTYNGLHVINTLSEYAYGYVDQVAQAKIVCKKSNNGDYSTASVRLIGVKFPSNIHLSFSGSGANLTGNGSNYFVTETGSVISKNVQMPEILPLVELNSIVELTDGDVKKSFKVVKIGDYVQLKPVE